MLISIINFYCLSVGKEPDSGETRHKSPGLPKHTHIYSSSHHLSCILYALCHALWFEEGKKWFHIREPQITDGLLSISNH